MIIISMLLATLSYLKNKSLNQIKITFLFGLFILYSVISVMIGLMNYPPGAIKMMQEYIIWPIVYLYILSSIKSIEDINLIQKSIFYSIVIVILYSVVLLIIELGAPLSFLVLRFNSFPIAVNFYGTLIEMTYPGMNSMAYGIGFFVGCSIISLVGKKFLKFSFLTIILIVFIYITGRRIFIPLVIIAYGISFYYLDKNVKRKVIYGTIVFSLIAIIFFNRPLSQMINSLTEAFFDDSGITRQNQIYYLIQGWLSNSRTFLLGHGHGSFTPFIIRSQTSPWAYEMFYIALLFQTGLIGIIIYGMFFVSIVIKGLKSKKIATSSFTLGTITLLLASITNPYMMRFDGIWMIILSFVIVNKKFKIEERIK